MFLVAISVVVYLCLIGLAPVVLWQSASRLMDIRALKGQIRRSVANLARVSGGKA
jgi:hypothetical protein